VCTYPSDAPASFSSTHFHFSLSATPGVACRASAGRRRRRELPWPMALPPMLEVMLPCCIWASRSPPPLPRRSSPPGSAQPRRPLLPAWHDEQSVVGAPGCASRSSGEVTTRARRGCSGRRLRTHRRELQGAATGVASAKRDGVRRAGELPRSARPSDRASQPSNRAAQLPIQPPPRPLPSGGV
jgi:hypothetical protein